MGPDRDESPAGIKEFAVITPRVLAFSEGTGRPFTQARGCTASGARASKL